ncbi:HupE/UreJ family protein [Stappia sp. ES.058]|uniref:HupE/UreJ family protein n=1 Tax=Stappia sp. ES.058 TaxID=1881061 RepID=UPI000879F7B5|nr:HupE/UreJ family protein [Stappia sp. ES.058]SDU02654.1 urease accessory protein [Stappia sp. ES.058]
MTRRSLPLLAIASAAMVTAATPALAHLSPGEHGSFAAGLSHPLFGADHILAMVAVGLWAWQIGGKAVVAIPSAFVVTMVAGFGLALAGVSLPFVEPAILASVVALGLLVALAVRLPLGPSAAIVGVFALFHGYAHGGEIGSAAQAAYGLGFALSTIVLHLCGIAIGWTAGRLGSNLTVSRVLGGITALAGVALISG